MRSFFVIAALATLFWPATILAAGSERSDCATIQDNAARLDCYDARFGAPETATRSINTNWTVSWSKDGSAVLITTRSRKPNVAASGGVVSNFILACIDKDIKALIIYPPQMPRERIGSEISLDYETDNGKTESLPTPRSKPRIWTLNSAKVPKLSCSISQRPNVLSFGRAENRIRFSLRNTRLKVWQRPPNH